VRSEEHDIQCALVGWCDVVACAHPSVGLYIAIPNGGHRDVRTAVRLKREGVRAGVPDLFWPEPRDGFHGLWIELKAAKGRLSTAQKEWIEHLNSAGYLAIVCYGLQNALEAVAAYFNLDVRS
jgi:hypothetical protein